MGGTSSMSWKPETWGTSDPNTGDANSPIGRFFQGAFGKHGSTTAKLPPELQWINQFTQGLAGQGASNLSMDPSNAAQSAGTAGATALGNAATGTEAGTAAAWNAGLGGLGQGLSTGFMPDVNSIDALLRPSLERSFQTGAADLREQNALTGNLSSSGTNQQMTDFRAQLENALSGQEAGILGQAMPASMNIRSGLTQTALGLPGANAQSIWSPATSAGMSGQDAMMKLIATAFGGISAAPYTSSQGSGGSGGAGALMGMGK